MVEEREGENNMKLMLTFSSGLSGSSSTVIITSAHMANIHVVKDTQEKQKTHTHT